MLDPKLLRTDLENTAAQLAKRGFTIDVEALSSLEEQRKAIQIKDSRITKSAQYSFQVDW